MRRIYLIIFIFSCIWIFIQAESKADVKKVRVKGPMHMVNRENTPEEEKKYELLDKLSIDEGGSPESMIEKFLKEYNPKDYKSIVAILIEVVADEDEIYEDRMVCARLLGRLRAKEGVKVLVDNILLSPLDEDEEFTPEMVASLKINKKDFPCAFALCEIGVISREYLEEKILTAKIIQAICEKTVKEIEKKTKK